MKNAVTAISTAMPPRTSANSSFSVSSLSSMLTLRSWEGKPHRFADPTAHVSESAIAEGAGHVPGHRVVVAIYVGLIAFAGTMGFVLGIIIDDLQAIALFGLIPIPPTPIGLAVYGAVTIAVALGVLLLLVRYVAPEDRR